MIEIFLYLCFVILAGRLFYLQIIMYEKYAKLAGKIQFVENQIPAERGAIYDRNGNVLAMDVPVKTLYIYTKNVDDKEKTVCILASILKMPAAEIRKKLDERYPRIKRKLSVEEYTAIEKENLKGVVFEDDYKRIYP
ncbi:MAG: peptidoglycan glycosyltransferase, partial [Candidatus Omnitrophica bacterium]|nr:peptidoglycan glycosyltransferase [Candidatus Omnitrophota bacterium]